MELSANKVNVDLETGSVIITGFLVEEIIAELGHAELLSAMDYSDIVEWVAEQEREKAEMDADYRSSVLGK